MATRDWSGVTFRKSSYSGGNGGCVGIARLAAVNGVHDTTDPAGPVLEYTPQALRRLMEQIRAGEYEL